MKTTKITISLIIEEESNTLIGSVMNRVKKIVCNSKKDTDIDFLGVTGSVEFTEQRIENGCLIIKSKV